MLQVPDFNTARDPVKDTLLVRVRAGQHEGWGECEAAPFVSLAAFLTPESHDTCRPVGASVLGMRLDDPMNIAEISRRVATNSMNVLQAPHVYSGVEMALWDALGKRLGEPVYRLLGYEKAFPKQPYVVAPFAPTPEETYLRTRDVVRAGYRAVKTGWSGFGNGEFTADRDQLAAARDGLGPEGRLFLDAARVWGNNVAAAKSYSHLLDQFGVEWVEEPFDATALGAYAEFSHYHGRKRLAAGENVNSVFQARQLLDVGDIGIIQIDCGRIGGIAAGKEVALYAERRGASFVNHTYTSHLALSASLHSYAGLERQGLCEYPIDHTALSWAICDDHLLMRGDGTIRVPEKPGLGIAIDGKSLQNYLVDLEIKFGSAVLYRTPFL
nr:mandelate racemase/muconate lactonizing enzyme family protein [Sinorhizobium mexicanum]